MRTSAGLTLALALLLAVGALSYSQLQSFAAVETWHRHALEVLNQIEVVSTRLVDAETGQRGYLLTGRTEYLEPYTTAHAAIPHGLRKLRALTTDEGAQQARLDQLDGLVAAKLAELQETVALRTSRGIEEARAVLETGRGKYTMDEIRLLLHEMETEERLLLDQRMGIRGTRNLRAIQLMWLGTGFSIVLVIGTSLALNAQARRRLHAQARQQESEERLRVTLCSIGDAVIATDRSGTIVFMNPEAESLTGWRERDAHGHPLPEIFAIVNEETRQTVESPVDKVLRDGTVVGLANHTVLLARDGREIPIDDSGAPIRDADSEITGVVLVYRDISERKHLEEEREKSFRAEAAREEAERTAVAVRISEERYRSLIAASTSTVWTAAPDHALEGSSPAAHARSSDDTRTASLGWTQALHEDDRGRVAEQWANAQAESLVFETEGRIWNAALRCYRHTHVRGVPLLNTDRSIREWVGTIEDVHEQREAELAREELLQLTERARSEAQAANQATDQFLSVLSHELRSPLQTMITWVKMMLRAEGPSPRRVGEVLLQSIHTQEQLINDLLDVSRIASGKLTVERRDFDGTTAIASCVDQLQPTARAKGITMIYAPSERPLPILGDPERMRQALCNVLLNALEFTPTGGRVEVEGHTLPSEVEIVVRDNGEGIAPEILPHIFDRFRQADSGKTRRHGGLGLGLAIARHVIEAQGGRITGNSAGKDRGATFLVRLPLGREERQATAPAPSADGGEISLAKVHILLVEDDLATSKALATLLQDLGSKVSVAGSVRQARDLFAENVPDVVVSDVGMPEESGYVLIREIRAREALTSGHIPALAMTGFTSKEDRNEARDAGFDDHVTKPVDPDVLAARIHKLLS